MSQYTLIYFNGRGRAELIRWIFTYAEIPFTDERLTGEEWASRKASIPGGKLPVLKVGDKYLPQSLAIARFAAKVAGIVPEDRFQAAMCDALADTLSDMMTEVYKVLFASGDKEEQMKKWKEEVHPNNVVPILKRLEDRFGKESYFVSNKLTWSDLMLTIVFSGILKKSSSALDGFPKVKAHMDKILAIPQIKAWNDKQPETAF